MTRKLSGRSILGIGKEALPPSGGEDRNLRLAMRRQAHAFLFSWRVNLWSRSTGRGAFRWTAFYRRLKRSEFRSYATWSEALQSLGWSGLLSQAAGSTLREAAALRRDLKPWLFGVAGYTIPFYGKSAMRHELFHAAQDHKTRLFDPSPGLLRSLVAEYSAHLWGGPLIGLPIVYGGSLFIVLGVAYIIYALASAF